MRVMENLIYKELDSRNPFVSQVSSHATNNARTSKCMNAVAIPS